LHDLDTWIRRRLRSDHWKPWGRKRYRQLRKRGVGRQLAWNTVTSAHGPWRLHQSPALSIALPQRYFTALGLPSLSDAAGAARELGIFARQADKGTALAFVLARLAVNREQVLVIGDNLNDLPMFPYARVSVAMGNAPEAVKQQATMIAPRNDEEGVAWVLEAVGLAQGGAPT